MEVSILLSLVWVLKYSISLQILDYIILNSTMGVLAMHSTAWLRLAAMHLRQSKSTSQRNDNSPQAFVHFCASHIAQQHHTACSPTADSVNAPAVHSDLNQFRKRGVTVRKRELSWRDCCTMQAHVHSRVQALCWVLGSERMPLPQALCNRNDSGDWLDLRGCDSIAPLGRNAEWLSRRAAGCLVAPISTNITRTYLWSCT